jgi:hypothetical protein
MYDTPDTNLTQIGQLRAEVHELGRKIDEVLRALRLGAKDYYTTEEAAVLLRRKPETVREWCRLGQCRAEHKKVYRGGKRQWTIHRDEILRLEREGPAPIGTFRLPALD